MDLQYIEQELESHACPICYELMCAISESENNNNNNNNNNNQKTVKIPVLLIPCGHSLCNYCLEQHKKKCKSPKSINCPLCREVIKSSTVNRSFQQLIESLVKQKEIIIKNKCKLDNEAKQFDLVESSNNYLRQYKQL